MNYCDIPHAESYCDAEFFEEQFFPGAIDWTFYAAMPTAELARVIRWEMNQEESRDFADCAAAHCYSDKPLLEDIREHGIREPLVEYYGKLEGNHRFAAAIALGLPTVPVYRGTSKE